MWTKRNVQFTYIYAQITEIYESNSKRLNVIIQSVFFLETNIFKLQPYPNPMSDFNF